jgi:hypothetical protein
MVYFRISELHKAKLKVKYSTSGVTAKHNPDPHGFGSLDPDSFLNVSGSGTLGKTM